MPQSFQRADVEKAHQILQWLRVGYWMTRVPWKRGEIESLLINEVSVATGWPIDVESEDDSFITDTAIEHAGLDFEDFLGAVLLHLEVWEENANYLFQPADWSLDMAIWRRPIRTQLIRLLVR